MPVVSLDWLLQSVNKRQAEPFAPYLLNPITTTLASEKYEQKKRSVEAYQGPTGDTTEAPELKRARKEEPRTQPGTAPGATENGQIRVGAKPAITVRDDQPKKRSIPVDGECPVRGADNCPAVHTTGHPATTNSV